MIVLSNAMAKSASTFLCACTTDLVKADCAKNGHDTLYDWIKRERIRGEAGYVNYVQKLDFGTIRALLTINKKFGSVVAKCHSPITPMAQGMIQKGHAKATFSHRDPRDHILSAMDHCRLSQDSDRPRFYKYTSVRDSIRPTKWWCRITIPWIQSGIAFPVRYVDLVLSPVSTISKVATYLGLNVDKETIARVVNKLSTNLKPGSLLFNTGKVTRFRDEMTADEIDLCNAELGNEIVALGYEI